MKFLNSFKLAIVALAVVAAPGCAVLTVDVDVYKGPLINSERMKVEQTAAMAIAAKPLLLQLRSMFNNECADGVSNGDCVDRQLRAQCGNIHDQTDAVDDVCLLSWQARRVNAVISLYGDSPPSRLSRESLEGLRQLIRQLLSAATDFRFALAKAGKASGLVLPDAPSPESSKSDYAIMQERMFDRLSAEKGARKELTAAYTRLKQEAVLEPNDLDILRSALITGYLTEEVDKKKYERLQLIAHGVWRESFRLLASPEFRQRVAADRNDALDVVASTATALTSSIMLAYAFNDDSIRARSPEIAHFVREQPGLLVVPPVKAGASKAHAELLKARLLTERGALLAKEVAEIEMPDDPSIASMRIVSYGDAASIQQNVQQLQRTLELLAQTGLQHGRRDKGIERLMQEYMSLETLGQSQLDVMRRDVTADEVKKLGAQVKLNKSAQDLLKKGIRDELLDSLVDLGQKIAHMANLQSLLPTKVSEEQRKKNIQLLQAIGNSILNQIDDYKKLDDHKKRQRDFAGHEATALRNARLSLSGAAIADLLADIARAPDDVADKPKIVKALAEGDAKLRDAAKLMQGELASAQKTGSDAKDNQERWGGAKKALSDADLATALGKAVTGAKDDASFTKAARDALGAYADARAAEEAKKADKGRSAEYVAARKALDQILSKDVALKAGTSPENVVKVWVDRLDRAIGEAAESARKSEVREKTLRNWLARTESAMTAQVGAPDPGGKPKSVLEVIDAALAELEYSRLLATRAGLTNLVDQINGAIAYAQQRRVNMQFIRPASIYLRDSYPATVLQRSPANSDAVPNLIWRKLQTAFSREETEEDLSVRNVIDKQFWQTVNQIRLGGGGATNYVVAKDDLGNWYIRGYENDVSSIVKSMSNLALFAYGSQIQANLLAKPLQSKEEANGTGQQLGPTNPAARSVLGNQLDKANKDYRDETLKNLKNAREAAGKLRESLIKEAKEALTGEGKAPYLETKKDKVFKSEDDFKKIFSLDDSGDADKKIDKLNEELQKILSSVLGYFKEARDKFKELTENKDKDNKLSADDNAPVAKRIWQAVRNMVDRRVAESETAAAKLEGRLTFIDQVVGAGVSQPAK